MPLRLGILDCRPLPLSPREHLEKALNPSQNIPNDDLGAPPMELLKTSRDVRDKLSLGLPLIC
jgi:hypothetical protein